VFFLNVFILYRNDGRSFLNLSTTKITEISQLDIFKISSINGYPSKILDGFFVFYVNLNSSSIPTFLKNFFGSSL
jgi:hypothetical protein